MKLLTVRHVTNIRGKRVLMRVSLNVPVRNGEVVNDFRIKKVLPTILYLRERGARVILLAHLSGRLDSSLRPVYEFLKRSVPVTFIEDSVTRGTQRSIRRMKNGDVVLLENLRRNPGEVENDESFAKQLAQLGDVYVNEDFPTSHRRHASIVGLPKFLPSYIGLRFLDEITHLSRVLIPSAPFLLVLGGAKPETKIPLAKKFLDIANNVVVAGSLSNEFFKEKGYNIGKSRFSGDKTLGVRNILEHPRLVLPVDVQVKNKQGVFIKRPEEVLDDDAIFDSGPETLARIKHLVHGARLVVWNGPLGDYEEGFRRVSEQLVRILASSDAQSIVGGGDTVATIARLGLESHLTFVSTAGGAMLDYLQDGSLPGIVAIEESLVR